MSNMNFKDVENIFNRSLLHTFSKRKCLMVFPILAFCGLLIVICRGLAHGASQWIQMTLTFLPIFLCAGFLLGIGLVLVRIYHHEVKGLQIQYIKTIRGCKDLFLEIPYLAVPLIFFLPCSLDGPWDFLPFAFHSTDWRVCGVGPFFWSIHFSLGLDRPWVFEFFDSFLRNTCCCSAL